MIFVAEITVCTDAAGTTATYYFSSGRGWSTKATDTPANTFIEPRLIDAGSYRREMWSSDALFGPVRSSFGNVRLANGDGGLDAWCGYAVDGRAIKVYMGSEEGLAYPSGYTLVYEARMLTASFDVQGVDLVLRDRMVELEKPILQSTFAGTGGLEGPASMAKVPIPRAYGDCFLLPVVLIDSSKNIYLVAENQTGSVGQGVYEAGIGMTLGANYADTTSLQSTAPAAGTARWFVGGPTYVRFGTTPVGSIQVTGGSFKTSAGASGTVAHLAAEAGISGATGTLNDCEIYVDDPGTTYLEVMSREARTRPGWFGFDRTMSFVAEPITDPSGGSPVGTITHWDVESVRRQPPPGIEIPIWRVAMRGRQNYATREGLAAGAADPVRQEFYSAATDSDATVKTKHPRAGELALDCGGYNSGGAAAYLDLHGIERDTLEVIAGLTTERVAYDLGDVVTFKHPRFGLSGGKKYLMTAVEVQCKAERIGWQLWG